MNFCIEKSVHSEKFLVKMRWPAGRPDMARIEKAQTES
jgi:hypothetical protein